MGVFNISKVAHYEITIDYQWVSGADGGAGWFGRSG